jgi:hypothetical protein
MLRTNGLRCVDVRVAEAAEELLEVCLVAAFVVSMDLNILIDVRTGLGND